MKAPLLRWQPPTGVRTLRRISRPLRICYPDAMYHVIARGNERRAIVRDDVDRETFLEVYARTAERFILVTYAYCLMDNHYHLVVQTPRGNLPLAMRQLNGCYAAAFNRRHERIGHLFHARYRAILIEDEPYLLDACRYAILNPARTTSPTPAIEYRWSSYRGTIGLDRATPFLAVGRILAPFGGDNTAGRRAFRAFIDTPEEPFEAFGERLGGDAFLRRRHHSSPPLEIPRIHNEPIPPSLDEIFAVAVRPIATAYRDHGYTLGQIAAYLGCHYSTVSRKLRREEHQAA